MMSGLGLNATVPPSPRKTIFPHFLVEVTEADVGAKIEALSQYKTYHEKYYFDPMLLRATMVRHGTLAEREFAEGFDILRIVGKFEDR